MRSKYRLLYFLWLCFVLVISCGPARAESELVYEDLIIAVRTDSFTLSDAIHALEHQERAYIPLGTLADLLGFYIELDISERTASGYIGHEKNRYSLSASEEVLAYEAAGEDLYVSLEQINKLWPVAVSLDKAAQVLMVQPTAQLPIEASFERKKRQDKLARNKARQIAGAQRQYTFMPAPYRAFSLPALDINTQAGYLAHSNEATANMTLTGVQDLAYASADYSVSMGQTGNIFHRPENIRLRLRRQNIHEGALPFDLEDVQAGDVRLAHRERISSGQSGRGVIFTNKKQGFVDDFDLITIEGVGPPGWEAELYLNNQLIDFGVVDERGEYRFEDVSVGYGNNRLKTILYGPQGQVREESEEYNFKTTMARRGETIYSGGIIDAGHDFIPLEERTISQAQGLAANLYVARGVNPNLTIFGSGNIVPQRNGSRDESGQYLSAGAIASLGRTLIQAEAYQQAGAGQAIDVRTQHDIQGFKLNTRLSAYHRFDSEEAGFGERAKRLDVEATIRRTFTSFFGTLGLELGGRHFTRRDDTHQTEIATRQSLSYGGVHLTNTTGMDMLNGEHAMTDGMLSASARMLGWRLRGNIGYDIYPDPQVSRFQAELRRGSLADFSTAFTAGYDFNTDETMAGIQFTKDFDKLLGSVETNWSSDHGIGLMLRASASFGPYGREGSYMMTSQPLRQVSPVSARIFRDHDGDGFYTDGDEPIENVRLTINDRARNTHSDKEGHLNDLAPASGGEKYVALHTGSVSDPYLMPALEGYSLYPRPGVIQHLDFPLVDTGAIDGTVRQGSDGKPIPGLDLQLVDDQQKVVDSVRTARDGFFTFEYVRPGDYTIRPDPASGVNIPAFPLKIDKDNLFQFGSDILTADVLPAARS